MRHGRRRVPVQDLLLVHPVLQYAILQIQTALRQGKQFHTFRENGVRNPSHIILRTAQIWRVWHGADQLLPVSAYVVRMTEVVSLKTVMVRRQATVIIQ